MSDTTKTRTAALETITALYNAARGQWTGADWTHDLRQDGRDMPVTCNGEEFCETCRDAAHDARVASCSADAAMHALRAGDRATAARMAEGSRRREEEWGDSPTWGDWAHAVEALA